MKATGEQIKPLALLVPTRGKEREGRAGEGGSRGEKGGEGGRGGEREGEGGRGRERAQHRINHGYILNLDTLQPN